MKLITFFTIACISTAWCATTHSQVSRVNIDANNVRAQDVISQIEEQTDYLFVYNQNKVNLNRNVSIQAENSPVAEVLTHIFRDTDIIYAMEGNNILLLRNESEQAKRQINGTVYDQDGEPVIGANITIKGSTTGTITDVNGLFTIQADDNDIIVVSYIGYLQQEIIVGSRSNILITLREDSQTLEEIVIVGYGTQKKANLTGAVATINLEKEAESRPITTLSTALSGMSAGLQVMQNSGMPNSDGASIRIRGVGTLNSASPLVLVDGVEQNMSDINPHDVATITVLKDAASSAIYGNRAANGVILITTKEGTKGKVNVSYRGLFSWNQPTKLIKTVNNYADYMELMNESSVNVGQAEIFTQATIDKWRTAEKDPNGISESGYPNYVAYPNTDWYKEIFQNKMMHEQTVSVVGASDKVNFNFSGTYLDNPGLVDGTGIKKYYVRSNIIVDVTDWLKVGNRTWGYQSDLGRNAIEGTLSGIGIQKLVPGVYPYYNGYYGAPEATEEDPQSHNGLWDIQSTGGSYTHSQINTTMLAEATFLKDFVYRVNFNYSRYWTEHIYTTKSYGKYSFSQDQYVISPVPSEELSSMFYTKGEKTWKFDNTLTWGKTFNWLHEVGALIGYEEMRYTYYHVDAQKKGLIDETITDLSTATEMLATTGRNSEYSSRSVFGRASYAFNNRYLLETNIRYDGSSRFSPDSRWGVFPSFSAGWRIMEESFMERVNFDNLKLRGSWGKLGNNAVANGEIAGNYAWQSVYSTANYSFGGNLNSGLAQTSIANSLLKWETTTIADVGLDIGLLGNRLTAELDWYNKVTSDILYTPDIYLTMGNKSKPYQNIAEMTNRGFEVNLGWHDKAGKVNYSVTGNFAYNKNRVSKYKGELVTAWVPDENGNLVYETNLGDVSTGSSKRVIEGKLFEEFYLINPYKGDQTYFNGDGSVNINGGPKDGMIRTEQDMNWLQAMMDAGYSFYPNQSIGKDKIWYGDYIFADENGDGIYGNTYDNTFQGTSQVPKFNFGLQASAMWNGFDFSMNWAGAAGFSIYWKDAGQNSSATIYGYGIGKDVAKDHYFYDPDNPSDSRTNLTSATPRLTRNHGSDQSGSTSSTLYLHKGDYLKLKNLTIGYTLPAYITRKIYTNNVRVFISGENLLTITGFKGMDPEMVKGVGYVTMRQYAFGFNITF